MSTPNKFTLSPLTVPLNDKRHYAIRDGIYMTQLKWCWHNKCFIEHWAIYCSTKIVRIQSVNPACGEGECIKLESNKLNYRERECLVYVNGKVVNLHNDICTPFFSRPHMWHTTRSMAHCCREIGMYWAPHETSHRAAAAAWHLLPK